MNEVNIQYLTFSACFPTQIPIQISGPRRSWKDELEVASKNDITTLMAPPISSSVKSAHEETLDKTIEYLQIVGDFLLTC